MSSRILYFVTDCDFPRFPLTAISRQFRLVSIPPEFSNSDWFNWEASGCLVFECIEWSTAISLLEFIRSQWISLPSALFGSGVTHSTAETRTAGFSAVFQETVEVSSLADELKLMMDIDHQGDPSPLEIRQRFGRLANQERKVLQLSLEGLTSKEIALQLGIRSQTVDKYKRNGLARMKTRNMTLLLRQLYQSMGHRSLRPSFLCPN